jgi:hypothetical protein
MAKIKSVQHTTPSEKVILDAHREVEVFDTKNRKFTLKTPDYLKEMQFIEAMGASKDNDEYRANAFFLSFIHKIDDVPVPVVNTKQTLEALMKRVAREGALCVMKAVKDNFFPEQSVDEEAQKQEIKK